jgi:site-specific recombinase XerD
VVTTQVFDKAKGQNRFSSESIIWPFSARKAAPTIDYRVNGIRYVFPDEDGNRIYKNRLLKRYKTLAKRLNFGEADTIHAPRHAFASHLVMKGVDPATVKKLMGHSDIDTTMIYSHLTEKHVDSVVEKWALVDD